MPEPRANKNTLLLIALDGEAADFLPHGAEPYWVNPKSTGCDTAQVQKAYRFNDRNLTVGMTGPEGHSFVSVGSKLLLDNQQQGLPPFERIVNFGAVGAYPWSNAELLSAYFVAKSRRWDEIIPARGFDFYTETADLCVPPGQKGMVCLSSNRFSSDFDRQTHRMLDGDLEDFELYDMARVTQVIGIPFYSIKFVTNITTPEGAQEFFKNLPAARAVGTQLLRSFLECDSFT